MSVFSERFYARRKELNLTQQEIADKLNVGHRTVSHWENGAYPDGELLPKIAEVLGVSLDYLFGTGNFTSSVEQEIMNSFKKEINIKNHDISKEFLSKIFDILWAIQISWQKENTTYWKAEKVDYKKASAFFLENGFSFLQHKSDSRFYCLCEKPEKGFSSLFENTEKISNFLKFLADSENQKILIELFSLKGSEYISIPAFSKKTKLNEEKILNAITFLGSIKDNYGNSIIYKINFTNKSGKEETLYKILIDKSFLILMIYTIVNELIEPTPFFDNSVFLYDHLI